jgi:hypothetical protein
MEVRNTCAECWPEKCARLAQGSAEGSGGHRPDLPYRFSDTKGGSQYGGADISTDVEESQAFDLSGVNDAIPVRPWRKPAAR